MSGPRWAGVPVTMESGKRMGEARKRIVVTFRHPHPCLCEQYRTTPTRWCSRSSPSDQIEIVFCAKKPGFDTEVEERRFSFFLYEKQEKAQYVEEYAKLLYDAIRGDQTLFVSTREVDARWRFIDPIVDGWQDDAVPLESYAPDSSAIVEVADVALAEKTPGGRDRRVRPRQDGRGPRAQPARSRLAGGRAGTARSRRREAMATEGLEPAETRRRAGRARSRRRAWCG